MALSLDRRELPQGLRRRRIVSRAVTIALAVNEEGRRKGLGVPLKCSDVLDRAPAFVC